MDELQITCHLENAVTAILRASTAVMAIYRNKEDFTIAYKTDQSPVTRADIVSSDIIYGYLEKTGLPVICEERGKTDYEERKNWEWFWLVDPLDGTKEFIKRNGEFTLNIALVHHQVPVLGVIAIPAQNYLYWGLVNNGSYKIPMLGLNEPDYATLLSQSEKISVQKKRQNTLRIMVSRSHLEEQTLQYIEKMRTHFPKIKKIQAGSSLKFCYIAEGKADVYLRFSPTMEWDTAAGHAIVIAAGAEMRCLPSQKEFLYNKEELVNEGFIVSFF